MRPCGSSTTSEGDPTKEVTAATSSVLATLVTVAGDASFAEPSGGCAGDGARIPRAMYPVTLCTVVH